ncbi:COP1-interacting protein 7 isoform X2 [Jatropha curcas]|uniref:COP1-interacting protein 7 isoform X2 n=1 Tax=Jatropha curcas TaxID=180498 RepID=UPI00189583B6|nr:COP1-interacting protein 7 isoform X2 [Jatropha curcas]
MESGIDADAPLDYATIDIFPAQNRYEVFICSDDEVEKLAIGLLEQLSPHLPGVNNLHSIGSNAKFKLQVVGLDEKTWFTKSTLNRFLQLVASPELLISCKLIEGEMTQLEEARKFHLCLYAQGRKDHLVSAEKDGSTSIETAPIFKPEEKIASSDTSKDELLRAMDLRLTALRKELAASLNQTATFSSKDVINLIYFCDHFGATDLKNSLSKFLELSCKSDTSVLTNDDKNSSTGMSRSDNADKINGEIQISRSIPAQTPVKYGVSPAVVAQVERQSSTESEESNSGDENQVSVERGRVLTRSAQPRRSASPMRRIQIGRTGSRRAPALAIKSLGYYPPRERNPCYRDVAGNNGEEEGSEQISKKPESNVLRMSVQDAINLFESKQKDQSADAQKRSSLSNHSLSTNKSVLRRWSAGRVECSVPCQELVYEDSILLSRGDVVDGENSNLPVEEKLESDFTSGFQNPPDTTKVNVESGKLEKRAHDSVDIQMDSNATQGQESNGLSTSSVDWNQQKEAELNQMLKKMMESQPVRTRKPQSSRNQNIPSEHRGGFYDHYKEKRDEKLRGENAGKKAEKEARFRAMQKILDDRKAEMTSRSVKDVSKKHPSPKPQKSLKNPSQPANLRNEKPKASVTGKVSSKASNLPATRKSWPSAPSARVAGSSPSKTPGISSAGTTPTRRKPHSAPSIHRSSAKVERSQPRHRNVKESQANTDRSLKGATERVQQTATKCGKTTKTKVAAAAGDCPIQSKPSFYNKMTKKSSIVPLESKPFLRKGSRVAPGVGPIASKTKNSSVLEESPINCGNMTETPNIDVVLDASNLVSQHQDQDIVAPDHANTAMDTETTVHSHQNHDVPENINELTTDVDDSFKDTIESSAKIQIQEESVISPIAWEEIEEHQNVHSSYADGTSQLASPVHVSPLGLSSPRVRHSLSQMLQEDSSEPDTVEWGNAEHPPAIVYQKDAPKGLKRLLKFARKSKGDANLTGWSSPSVFSEGEDDGDECKAVGKRSTDNMLRKTSLHSKNYGQQNASFFTGHEKSIDAHELLTAQSNFIKFDAQTSQKLQKGHVSTAASTAKAFRGSKPNDTKFH